MALPNARTTQRAVVIDDDQWGQLRLAARDSDSRTSRATRGSVIRRLVAAYLEDYRYAQLNGRHREGCLVCRLHDAPDPEADRRDRGLVRGTEEVTGRG